MTSPDSIPRHWDLLSTSDRGSYTDLHLSFSDPMRKTHRVNTWQTFADILDLVRSFVIQNNADDWRRAVVCGIYWFPDNTTIAVNIRQLKLLVSKCKSSINGAFHVLGFGIQHAAGDSLTQLKRNLPFLCENFSEFKQWTIRQQNAKQVLSPAPAIEEPRQFGMLSIESEGAMGFERNYEPIGCFSREWLFEDPVGFVPNESELKDWDSSTEFGIRDWREIKLPDFTR
jgi:hypothetical protein